jgi:hypothetical protein
MSSQRQVEEARLQGNLFRRPFTQSRSRIRFNFDELQLVEKFFSLFQAAATTSIP